MAVSLDEAWARIGASLQGLQATDTETVIRGLDDIAARIAEPSVEALVAALFGGSHPFRGNQADYYAASNSLVHRVLERRIGIPISLSILTIEVGRRLGLDLSGVGMPAHFIVGVTPSVGFIPELFIDPFHGGQLLNLEQCQALFHRVVGQHQPFDRLFLAVTPTLGILERVLNNLKAIYSRNGDLRSLRTVMILRSRLPGIGAVELDEFRRLMAPLN